MRTLATLCRNLSLAVVVAGVAAANGCTESAPFPVKPAASGTGGAGASQTGTGRAGSGGNVGTGGSGGDGSGGAPSDAGGGGATSDGAATDLSAIDARPASDGGWAGIPGIEDLSTVKATPGCGTDPGQALGSWVRGTVTIHRRARDEGRGIASISSICRLTTTA